MKLFNNIFLILFAAFLYTSCEKEVIVDMDNSAGMKVQQTIDHYTKELTEASYGWIVDVKTNEGYYQFLMHFTDDNFVTMYTDNLNYPDLNGKPKESTYNFRSLQRITLSFDTYSYLAIINDPDNSISGGTNNQGLVTDFDFEIDNYTNGIFTMTGRINRVPAKMRRATVAEKVAVENGGLMNSLRNLLSYKPDRYTYFSANGADVSVIFSGRMMDIAYFDREGTLVETTADLNIRPTFDIELPEYFNINGADLTGFRWDAAKGEFSAVVESRRYELETGDRSVIPFYKLFGLNRKYTYMTTLIDIFDANNSNMIYRYMNISSNLANTKEANITFIINDLGNPAMRFTLYVTSGLYSVPVSYDYEIVYNEEGDEFTVGTMKVGYDPYGYGLYLDQMLYAYSIIRYWENRTFIVDWSTKTYNSWKTGSIKEKSNPVNEFVGVFF